MAQRTAEQLHQSFRGAFSWLANSENHFRQAELPAPPPDHLDRLAPPSFSKGSENRSDEEN